MHPSIRFCTMIVAGLCLAAAVGAQAPAGQAPSGVAALVKQAGQLNNEGQHDEALKLYREALQQSPDSFEANQGAGVALDLKGDYAEAQKYLAKAIQAAPPKSKGQAMRAMAMSYAFARKPKQAEKYEVQAYEVQMADKNYEGAASVANELARILLELGDRNGAARWYAKGYQTAQQIPDLKPADKDLWEFRWEHAQARLAARRGQRAEAEKHVAAAKAIFDKGTLPQQQAQFMPYLTGYVAFYAGDYKAALADLRKSNQNDPFIMSLMAQSYEKLGDQAQATALYRKILEVNAHNPVNAFARPLARQKVG